MYAFVCFHANQFYMRVDIFIVVGMCVCFQYLSLMFSQLLYFFFHQIFFLTDVVVLCFSLILPTFFVVFTSQVFWVLWQPVLFCVCVCGICDPVLEPKSLHLWLITEKRLLMSSKPEAWTEKVSVSYAVVCAFENPSPVSASYRRLFKIQRSSWSSPRWVQLFNSSVKCMFLRLWA